MLKYIKVWVRLAQMSFMMQLANRWSSLGWLGGKLTRLIFFIIFLLAIFNYVESIAGYSLMQVALFFLTFNIIDIIAQLFLRGIYMIGRDIREGDMDFYLIQPVNPLFRSASNLVDFLDFLTLLPVLILTGMVLARTCSAMPAGEMIRNMTLYFLLCVNGLVISFSLHVLIASLTVRTQQMENTIWLYRDVVSLGRFPIDVYSKSFQLILTFALPIGVMISFPTQALLGLLTIEKTILAFSLSLGLLWIAMTTWRRALKHYCSVSS